MDAYNIGYTLGPWIIRIIAAVAGFYVGYELFIKHKEKDDR